MPGIKMNKKPLVSVIVNNYNNKIYLKECLDALKAQTYKNIEIIIIDAYSTDGSREFIEEYIKIDTRFRLINTEIYEKYPATTYNLGFLNAKGNYIAINDPDDISMPNRLEKQMEYMIENPFVGAVGCNCIEFNQTIHREVITTVSRNIKSAAPPVRNPTLLFKKIILAKFGMWRWECEYAADFEWLYRWYKEGVKFHIVEEILLKYRYSHGKNLSNVNSISQSYKLAKFRIIYGFKLFNEVGYEWWKMTLKSIYYTISLSIKWTVRNKIK
jgi:glycosyltransferase involved in cell wall biosynthesis